MNEIKHSGFTLVELMIVVAIVGIIAAVAYPSYVNQSRGALRANAQGALVELSQFMERFYTENNRYNQDMLGNAVVLPFTQSPKDGTAKSYDLSLLAVADNDYMLQAVPIAGGSQDGDTCGTLTLANTGARTPANCW